MEFRKDINGLRAIAVIAVVLFHFNESWVPGGFAGVDVFFVISGFLMTGIIFRGFERQNFSILSFYVGRANRLIPALAVLCMFLLVFGWFYIAPLDYKMLGKHVGISMGFISNIMFWRESGYFDAISREKWLLHTWSLSVEWQFYIIYPLVLVALRKFMTFEGLKVIILFGTVLGFILGVIATYKWPNSAYFLLHTRAWELLIGGVAYLYPLKLSENRKKTFELVGLALIVFSYFFLSKENIWPGYLALVPVLGTFLLIQAQRFESIFTNNIVFQLLGKWSYSIYLWHWPLVVSIYYFSLHRHFIYLGIILSVFAGFLSYKYIESMQFRINYSKLTQCINSMPFVLIILIGSLGSWVFINNGFLALKPYQYQELVSKSISSPYRKKCHIHSYREPSNSCKYFADKITWAIFGDSHIVEIAYALAVKLKADGVGLKQFSFSECQPSFKDSDDYNNCSKWYNETIKYIIEDSSIRNVVFNHRFTAAMFGGDASKYPNKSEAEVTYKNIAIIKKIDELILYLASKKDNIYVIYPIPELPRPVNQLIHSQYRSGGSLDNIVGTDLDWYKNRNAFVIDHFDNASYPDNVKLINSESIFCDDHECFSVKEGVPLYYDDNHPSVIGAAMLVDLIEIPN